MLKLISVSFVPLDYASLSDAEVDFFPCHVTDEGEEHVTHPQLRRKASRRVGGRAPSMSLKRQSKAYSIQTGDSLRSITARFQMSTQQLKQLNGTLSLDKLQVGDEVSYNIVT